MKNQFVKITAILFLGLAVLSCKKAKNETEAKDAEEVSSIAEQAVRYATNVETSTISWKGIAPTKAHNGTLKVSEGYLAFEDGGLAGGNFVIDMKKEISSYFDMFDSFKR